MLTSALIFLLLVVGFTVPALVVVWLVSNVREPRDTVTGDENTRF